MKIPEMEKIRVVWIALAVVYLPLCRAELQPRLGGAAVYDTDLNVTWLTNANLAKTNTFGTAGINPDGSMDISAAQNWIRSMNLARYLGFSKWRLPSTPVQDPTCTALDTTSHMSYGYGCSGSELGHLFYSDLGAQSGASVSSAHNSNYGLFTNLQDSTNSGEYWSGLSGSVTVFPVFQFANGFEVVEHGPAYVVPVLTGDAGAANVLPQFVFGGGWYSALYFTNTTPAAVSFPVTFVSDSGTPLNVPTAGGSSPTVNLAAGGTAIIEAPNDGPLSQGYVLLSLPQGVQAYGVFRQSVSGVADQEAVVPLASAFSTSTSIIWDDTNFTTGVAIVNPSAAAAMVQVVVRDSTGVMLGTSSVALAPNNKTAVALRSLPGLAGVAGKRGSAEFTVSSGAVAVLGLRFNGVAFTSIPATQR